jgi:hypothetical protein
MASLKDIKTVPIPTFTSQPSEAEKSELRAAVATNLLATAAVAPETVDRQIRFDHPEAYGVFCLLPADNFYAQRCIDEFEDDLTYLETPPTFIRLLDPQLLFPGSLIYVAHPKTARVRDPETKRFVQQMSIHLSEPIDVKQFFGALDPKKRLGGQHNLRAAGLNRDALHAAITAQLANDPRGYFWLIRETPDGMFALRDN